MIRTFSPIRAAFVFVIITILFAALVCRVAYLETYGRQKIIQRADRQQHLTAPLQARRGCIFDRNGMLMAGTVSTQTLFADPKFMAKSLAEDEKKTPEQIDALIAKLADLLDKKPEDLKKLLADRSESRFVKLATHVDDNVAKEIAKLNIPGVGCLPSSMRNYPMGSLASHILGGITGDGVGLDGLELKFDKLLTGHDGSIRMTKDARRRPINVAAEDYLAPQHGSHIVTTIDATLQMIAEEELAASVEQNHAKRAEFVAMDPQTGEILALANYPTFNPDNANESTAQIRTNNCLVLPYEPGSTIKPFIAGPALSWNIIKPWDVFHTGAVRITNYGRKISDVHGYPQLCTWDVLVKSSNIGMTLIGERMGNTKLHEALDLFQFGRKTGIELPGENPGKVKALSLWGKASTDSIPQGYELMVTPLQLCRAICAYANGGKLVTPTILKGTLQPDGSIESIKSQSSVLSPQSSKHFPQVIDEQTAATIRRILADVPVRGTAAGHGSKIYNVFGKTGTAHIAEHGHYSPVRFNSSFIGGAPFENPRIVLAFIVHDPDKSIAHYGGAVSAPFACRFLERALAYMQVQPSPTLPPPPPQVASLLFNYHEDIYEKARSATASIKE